MPIYEFKCGTCEHTQEVIFLGYSSSNKLTTCNVCGCVAYRVPSRFGMHFVTDSEKIAKEKGLARLEPGMDKQAKENKKFNEEKRKSKIKKMVQDTIRQFDIPA